MVSVESGPKRIETLHGPSFKISRKRLKFACETKAQDNNVGLDCVATIGFVDMNVPTARQKQSTLSLVEGISIVNDSGDTSKNCCLLIMPDHPKDSSLRGLYDEEKAVIEACFGVRQHVETRFVDLFTRDRRSEGRSNLRRFSSGRIVVNGESFQNNVWMESELAVCGRPTAANEGVAGAPTSVLPKSSQLLLPEGASPDSDLKIADRVRPSPEQTSAQKGTSRLELLIESVMRHASLPKYVLVINLTGYVEEMASAVAWH